MKHMKRIDSAVCILAIAAMVLSGCGMPQESPVSSHQDVSLSDQIMDHARVSYLGPEGTYTEEAAQFFFPDAESFIPEASVPEAIDDIIVEFRNAGLELVTIHDRPAGSYLGAYRYVIEVENPDDITEDILKKMEEFPEVRCLGTFDVSEKGI